MGIKHFYVCFIIFASRTKLINFFKNKTLQHIISGNLSQLHFEASVRMRLTLPKAGTRSPLGLLQLQSSIVEVKTPGLEVFFIPLERVWSVDVENDLAGAIWTSTVQVMVKRRAGSQTGSLTLEHKKWGIDPILVCAVGVWHTVGKQVCFRPHPNPRSESRIMSSQSHGSPNRDRFGTPPWESQE